jgi:hypothetical protein
MPDAVRRRAKFDTEDAANDAIIRSDFRATVASSPTGELIELLRDAAVSGKNSFTAKIADHSKRLSIRLSLQSRFNSSVKT